MLTSAFVRFGALFSILLASAGMGGIAAEARYDLVIRNGRIVDGTGNPWFHADVAVRADRIAEVGVVAERGAKEIDARGLIVAPGFIDIHSHSDWVLFEDGNAESKVFQGVTTEVIGEGTSVAPFEGKLPPREVRVRGETIRIRSFTDYFEAVEKAGISVNVLSYVSVGNVWQCVMGTSFERPNEAQLAEMRRLVRRSMEEGAFGLSTALLMPPNSLATTDDIVELCKAVRPFGGIYSTHIRDEGLGVFDSVKEAIEVGERAGVPVDIIHLKIADQKYWGRMNEVIGLIEEARKRGLNVQGNVYPYTRGNNNLSSIIPPWAHEGGREQMLARLRDPETRTRIKRDIREGLPGWYNHYTAVGGDWSRMLISGENRYKGMTMDRVIAERSEGINPPPDPLDVLIDLLIENRGSVGTVYAHHTEADMNLALVQPWCSVGSDGSALATNGPLRRGHPHPRNFGTFPRVFGTYVRERGLLRVEDAVRKMSSLNAAKIGLQDRGILRPGFAADITIFHPDRIRDRSTYEDPFQHSEGIEYVIVNGRLVVESGRHTGARPGRALRKAAGVAAAKPSRSQPRRLEAQNAGEGPAWNAATKTLYFTGGNKISRLLPDDSTEVFREPSGGANGLLFDHEGRLVTCEARNRRVTRTEPDGRITVLADNFEGARFNSPNDLAIDSKGRIYFSDPRYGPRDTMEMRDRDGRLVEGVYRIDSPGRVQRILTHEVDRPNGLLVGPGDKHLFVADNNNNTEGGARKLWRFDLRPDGSVDQESRTLIFDWKTSRGPDGIKIDRQNRLFVAAGLNKDNPPFETAEPYKGGVYVLSLEGELLDFIPIPVDEVTNCAFGGDDMRTLFITAGGTLWSVRFDDDPAGGSGASAPRDSARQLRRESAAAAEPPYLFSVPIRVGGLPEGAEFVPVSTRIDFSALLEQSGAAGAVDERLIRLYRVEGGAREEIAVQFISEDQARPGRRRALPDTPPNVSYVAEYAAGETPDAARVAGELTWIARGTSGGEAEYLLEFGVRTDGRMIQVPFPPQNFRGFDRHGRGTPLRWFPEMQMHPQWPYDGMVHLYENQRHVTSYHIGPLMEEGGNPRIRRPFFHPVNGPDGIPLTEFGKPHDPTGSHAHHYSLWIAHADVAGNDFWSERGGIIAHDGFDLMEDGPIFCRFVQRTRWIAKGSELLREKRRMTLFKELGGFRIMDIELEFTPAGAEPVTFGKTSFGFLAVRVAQSMTVFDGAGEIRNSKGDLNERAAHLRRARWIDQSGPVTPERWGGIAMFDHPDNVNHPTGWHCRNDGWAGASFNLDESYALEPGESLRLKYRVHLHRGDAVEGEVEKRYREYAARPAVEIGAAVRAP